jgi:hypothetical protein
VTSPIESFSSDSYGSASSTAAVISVAISASSGVKTVLAAGDSDGGALGSIDGGAGVGEAGETVTAGVEGSARDSQPSTDTTIAAFDI